MPECVCLFLRFLSWPAVDIDFEYFSFYSPWLTYHCLVSLKCFKKFMTGFVKNLINLDLCHSLIKIYPFIAPRELLLSPSLILIWRHPFVHQRMNTETSQPSAPITSDKESSASHPVVGESLPSSFPYILTSPTDTNPTMLSSIFVTMVSSSPPPFTYPISSNSVLLAPSTSGASTGPSSSSLSGFVTTFHFGIGSSPLLGSGVSSTTTSITPTNTSIPRTFSLWSTPIVHIVPSSSQSGAGLSSTGQASRIVPESVFFPPTSNPSFS